MTPLRTLWGGDQVTVEPLGQIEIAGPDETLTFDGGTVLKAVWTTEFTPSANEPSAPPPPSGSPSGSQVGDAPAADAGQAMTMAISPEFPGLPESARLRVS